MGTQRPVGVEDQTIQVIPAAQRHGRARDLFTVWFGSNIMLLTVVTGALAATVYKLPFGWAVAALVMGNLVGAVFMALHSAQGPTLGVPQMVQTRGQFGSLGSLLVVGIVVIMYLGFLASNFVLCGQALHLIIPALSQTTGIVILGILTVSGAILGYDLIHAYTRALTYASGAALLLAFVWIFGVGESPLAHVPPYSASFSGVLGTISVAALWQIAYAPYVSDYSRYLPMATGARTAFWSSYWGTTLGSVLPMIIGAAVGLHAGDGEVVAALAKWLGPVAALVLAVLSFGMGATNAMNLYCGTLSTLSFGQTLVPTWSPRSLSRAGVAVALFGISFALALFSEASFLENYTNFILLLLYVLVPWTAINLVDYYFVQHGKYDVASFMRQDGGIYGRINVPAFWSYVIGIIVQVPFMSTPLYTGALAKALGGADLSWVVGLLVTCPLYYLIAQRIPAGAALELRA
jgi:NCS1 family nucleobase:cation symporter-1